MTVANGTKYAGFLLLQRSDLTTLRKKWYQTHSGYWPVAD
jgi:hypothetical protein